MKNNNQPKESKFKPFGAVIQKCPDCGKIDVSEGHEKDCDPELQDYRRQNQDNYWK